MRKGVCFSVLVLSAVGMLLVCSWNSQSSMAKAGSTEDRKVLYYVDPMNPSHTSDKPGTAPCGMAMEPVYADEEGTEGGLMFPGAVKISPRKQQLTGVQVGPVEETSHTYSFRTIGRVAPDETRIHRVIAGAPGFFREVSEVTTDSYVKKDQLLASFSSPDSIPSIQAYIVALNAMDRLRGDNAALSAENLESGATFQLRVEKLQELGLSHAQMEEIKETRTVPRKINVLSPVEGFVLARDASIDQKFDRGAEWYRIANLSHVWIVADIFEREARYIQPGTRARVSLPRQGKVFEATVAKVPPRFDAGGRTLKVRLETENPENVLRPDMLVDVEFHVTFPPAITVSADAVLDSGIRKTVFVDLGGGFFEPRAVETGWRAGDRVEIREGLSLGEKIVVSGNFLIDSESRIRQAASAFNTTHAKEEEEEMIGTASTQGTELMPGFTKCPVCGMLTHEDKARTLGFQLEHKGHTFSFCSNQCKRMFGKAPQRYAKDAARSQAAPALPPREAKLND